MLNGDIVDLLAASGGRIMSDPVYKDLSDTTEQVETVYILGNHDWGAEEYFLPRASRMEKLEVDGWHFLHGHQWDKTVAPFLFLARFFPIIPIIFPLPPFYIDAETLKDLAGPTDIYHFWRGIIEIGARGHAEGHRVNVCFGHTHLPLKVTSPTLLTIVNVGDWLDSYSYSILDEDGIMRLYSVWLEA